MKRLYKYMSALAFTGLLTIAVIGTANAQHRGGGGGGSHGGGGFHGGGGSRGGDGGFHGGGGFHGSSGFHGGGGGFRGGNSFRGNATVRTNSSFRGSVGVRGAAAYRGGVYNRGALAYGNHNGYRGGAYNRGGVYRGGYYRGGGYGYRGGFYRGGYGYRGYGSGFRFGFGWGYPHIGLYLGVLPFGYYPFYYNSYQYYYYGGAFYRPYNGGYQVVAPPVGAAVPNLPSNAQSIQIDGGQYYEASGVYYQESQDDNSNKVYVVVGKDGVLNTTNGGAEMNNYQPMSDNDDPLMDNNTTATDNRVDNTAPAPVVSAKVGDVVDQLPADCRKVTLASKKYYVSPDNVFYEEFKDADGTGYRVASVPGAEQ